MAEATALFPNIGFRTRIALGLVSISLATASAFGIGAYWAADIMEVMVLEDNIGELARRSAKAIAAGQSPPLPDDEAYYARFQSDADLEPELSQLQNGSHHDIVFNAREHHVWVQPLPEDRLFLIYDLTEIEEYESQLVVFLVSIGVLVGFLAFATGLWLTPWIAAPVTALTDRVTKLPTDSVKLNSTVNEDPDLAALADAINAYLSKNHELVERERAFTGMASHELRNPVASMMAALDVIELGPQPPEVALPLMRIRRSARRMQKLIDVLLDLARRDQDEPQADAQCDAGALTVAILEELGARPDAQRKQLDVDIDETVTLPVQSAMFEVVAGNLIGNAFDHSTGPHIVIRLDSAGLVVSSDGANAQFHRSGRLGLSIVDVICARLGWHFDYQVDERTTKASVRFQ